MLVLSRSVNHCVFHGLFSGINSTKPALLISLLFHLLGFRKLALCDVIKGIATEPIRLFLFCPPNTNKEGPTDH